MCIKHPSCKSHKFPGIDSGRGGETGDLEHKLPGSVVGDVKRGGFGLCTWKRHKDLMSQDKFLGERVC